MMGAALRIDDQRDAMALSSSDFFKLARFLTSAGGCPVRGATVAKGLLDALGSVAAVFAATEPKLRRLGAEVPHVEALHAAHHLMKSALHERIRNRPLLATRTDVISFLRAEIGAMERENLAAIFLDAHLYLLRTEVISVGSISDVEINTRAILGAALLVNAKSIIIAHNHPSGSLTPSREDCQNTMRLRDACRLVEINLLDHLIVSTAGFTSLASELQLP
jgi:DNA repair protein RadC